jgi:hypothetical protein
MEPSEFQVARADSIAFLLAAHDGGLRSSQYGVPTGHYAHFRSRRMLHLWLSTKQRRKKIAERHGMVQFITAVLALAWHRHTFQGVLS